MIIKTYIKTKLLINDKALFQLLELLISYQMNYEIQAHATKESNGVGFNRADANTLTWIYKKYKRNTIRDKDMEELRKRLPKYWGQYYKRYTKEFDKRIFR